MKLILIFGWYLILKIAEGGVVIGPYTSAIECMHNLNYVVDRLQDANVKLVLARCEFRQES